MKNGKSVHDFPRLGASEKTTQRQDTLIWRKSVADPNKNAAEIYKEMTTKHGHTLSKGIKKFHLHAVDYVHGFLQKNLSSGQIIGKSDWNSLTSTKCGQLKIRRRSLSTINQNSICLEMMVDVIFVFQKHQNKPLVSISYSEAQKRFGKFSITMVSPLWYTSMQLWIKMLIKTF